MRRVISIGLSVLFLYYTAGYFISFKAEQYLIKKSVKQRLKSQIPDEELTCLVFNPSSKNFRQIEWIEKHEFRYYGIMYDIVRQYIDKRGYIHYYCINDRQEEQLISRLKDYMKNHTDIPADHHQNKLNGKFSLFDFLHNEHLIGLEIHGAFFIFLLFDNAIIDGYCEVPSPPPKLTIWPLVLTLT
jgi:hypothetical protein